MPAGDGKAAPARTRKDKKDKPCPPTVHVDEPEVRLRSRSPSGRHYSKREKRQFERELEPFIAIRAGQQQRHADQRLQRELVRHFSEPVPTVPPAKGDTASPPPTQRVQPRKVAERPNLETISKKEFWSKCKTTAEASALSHDFEFPPHKAPSWFWTELAAGKCPKMAD